MTEKILEINLSPKQSEAFNLLLLPGTLELLYGGGKGGGKTYLGCEYVFYLCKHLVQFFDLKPSKYPPVVGFIGRKQSVDFTTTTLETWKRIIPPDAYEIKKQEKLIIIENTIAIRFGGLDDTDTINKFNSAEFVFFWLDQPEECTEKDVGMLRGTLRFKLNGKEPDYKALFSCNPVISDDPDFIWLKRDFIDRPKPGLRFLKALYTDNPFLPKNYGETLNRAYAFNPDLLAAYRDGEWDRVGAANVVIPSRIVKENVCNEILDQDIIRRRVTVCDLAGGDDDGEDLSPNDETVIYDLENTHIKDQEIYSHRDEMDTCGRIVAHQKKHNSSVVCVDKVGIGSAVYARLKEIYDKDIREGKIIVYGFDSRITAPPGIPEQTYANYKAYAWFESSKKYFKERKCYLPDDPVLIAQLSAVTFYFKSGGKMAITPKQKIRNKLGCSPDRADAYIMGLDALRLAKTVLVKKKDDGWKGGSYVPTRLSA